MLLIPKNSKKWLKSIGSDFNLQEKYVIVYSNSVKKKTNQLKTIDILRMIVNDIEAIRM